MKNFPSQLHIIARCATVTAFSITFIASNAFAENVRVEGSQPSQDEAAKAIQAGEDDAAEQDLASSSQGSQAGGKRTSLEEVLGFARTAYAEIDNNIDDYTCVLYKRERVDGKLHGWQSMKVKIRHAKKEDNELKTPLSVYVQFQAPSRVAGRAVLYVENRNNGDLIARRGGRRSPNVTFQLIPTSPLAMLENRYPITEIGFKNLAKRLIEVLEQEQEYNDGELRVWENAKLGDRMCIHYRLTHHDKRPGLTYHMAEVSVDDELGIPIRYGAYDFPRQEGGEPRVLEQYVYTDVRINVGLTDEDFDPENPEYEFQLHDDLEDKLTKE